MSWPDGFKWDDKEGRPVFTPPPMTAADVEKQLHIHAPALERAEELLWSSGHPRVAEQLHAEVARLMKLTRAVWPERAVAQPGEERP
jgi:hypothetical protein